MDFDGEGSTSSGVWLVIELFAGIVPGALALDELHIPAVHFYVEASEDAQAVIEANWPSAIRLGGKSDVNEITQADIDNVISDFTGYQVLLLAGPPCTDVSRANPFAKGALGPASGLRHKVDEIYAWLQASRRGSLEVVALMECTPMSPHDQVSYDNVFKSRPYEVDCIHWNKVCRKRWWWTNRVPSWPPGTKVIESESGISVIKPIVQCTQDEDVLLKGWSRCSAAPLRCFTTHKPGRRQPQPHGLRDASPEALRRWELDEYAQAPYHYAQSNCVMDKEGRIRRILPIEAEGYMGYPPEYTAPAAARCRQLRISVKRKQAIRHSLLGNAWHLSVTKFILSAILHHSVPPVAAAPAPPPAAQSRGTLDQSVQDRVDGVTRECIDRMTYWQDRSSRGMPDSATVGPDWAEQHAFNAAAKEGMVQPKRVRQVEAVAPLVPRGLTMDEHFMCAANTVSPMSIPTLLPDDLDFAIRTTASLGMKAAEWRRVELSKLREYQRKLKSFRKALDDERSSTSKHVAGNMDLALMSILLHAIRWPDRGLIEALQKGAMVAGRLMNTSIYRERLKEATKSIDEVLSESTNWLNEICRRKPGDPATHLAIWEKSLKEVKLKTATGPWSRAQLDGRFGVGKWTAMPRFAIWQNGKYRMIDDGKASGLNSTVEAAETIHTTTIPMGLAVLARFQYLLGLTYTDDRPDFGTGTDDMEGAYRQIPVHPSHECLAIAAVWNVHTNEWVFFAMQGLPFGLGAAVNQFNRLPAFLVAVARRILGLPVISFFDDFKTTDIINLCESCPPFAELCAILGVRLDEMKHQSVSLDTAFLGGRETINHPYVDAVLIRPKEGREDSIMLLINETIRTGMCLPSDAQSLRGKLVHLADSYVGRVGRACTLGLQELISQSTSKCSESTIETFMSIKEIIFMKAYKLIELGKKRPQARVYTDASFEIRNEKEFSRICFLVDKNKRSRRGGVADVPQRFFRALLKRKTQIAAAETVTVIVAICYLGEALRGHDVVFFIDSMPACYALLTGKSSVADLGTLAFGFHIACAKFGIVPWFEYVESESNVSDGGSREGITDPVARALGIVLEDVRFPHFASTLVQLPVDEWQSFWSDHISYLWNSCSTGNVPSGPKRAKY